MVLSFEHLLFVGAGMIRQISVGFEITPVK